MKFGIKPVLCCILVVLLGAGVVFSAEPDDSGLFVEAFNASHQKDYLLVIERLERLHQIFPDTPLRDISLLLMARAAFKSGDNDLAAKTIRLFTQEFPESNLVPSIEEELLALAKRQKKGEKLLPTKQLRVAAQKVRSDRIAMEQAAALKAEQERLEREKAERVRIAKEKAESERKERERLAAEKAAKESIRLAISLPQDIRQIEAGTHGKILFELHNKGITSENFHLAVPLPAEYAPALTAVDKTEALQQISLAAGETFKGVLNIKMPESRIDGYKLSIPLKAVSTRFSDVHFSKDILVAASAPLVRVVARPLPSQTSGGGIVTYRITTINAGSLTARDLTVRTILPQQLEFVQAAGTHQKESPGVFSFKIDVLETGRVEEFTLTARVKEDIEDKQELRCRIEVTNRQLQLKEVFNSAAAVVVKK
ncbi:DUF11 domain-containing protein [Pelotalea chapellei]|uniref:DUF11 domain-containing protein n=1 Tax=Pelotalea chapellei TaxID=44671 RepID=A0ABS5U6E2_9BACT|nr:hypothetical protein [Pelotalea chapellei]